ncbi:MFS transporter [Streptomyces sp. NPDC052396]|uniref:MFS transporter n=1 Tax=Streptomyces sp. NPDC052396 TaxID=3365689 RepID=UPI0037D3B6D4
MPITGAAPPARTRLTGLPAVLTVTTGLFSIVTVEILPIGLLTSIGADFTVSDGMAGLTMTMPGILAAVAAPMVTVVTARVDRRRMLCAFILLLAIGDFLAAAAPDYRVVLVSRALLGITIGGFWSIAAGLAERLVPAGSAGRATALMFSAVPLGSVLGVPLGTFVGHVAGWRTAFAAMGVLTTAVLIAAVLVLPPLPPVRVTRLSSLRDGCRGGGTRWALALTLLVVLAHFGAYTYVTPFLEQVPRLSPEAVTAVLLVYGAAGIAGNFAASSALSRCHPRTVLALAGALIALSALSLPLLGRRTPGALVSLALWGFAYGGVPVASQTCFARAAAPDAPETASVLFTASFQATMSLGALAGGVVVDRLSPSAVMAVGGMTALAAVPAAALARRPTGQAKCR